MHVAVEATNLINDDSYNFFFLTVVFSYLSNHMRMRKFRTR